jgi:hypothetical protein
MQSISNKRLGIGITGTPLDLVWINFSGGNGPAFDAKYSVSFTTEVKEIVQL